MKDSPAPDDSPVPDGSPAGRYREARKRATHPALQEFADSLPFSLDPFQVEACRAVEEQRSVLVAAPTGAGKTVVGEFAVRCARARNQKAFYTTPIKALSNQKYRDLVDAYGEKGVGLLTGDTSVNGNADIVVMTTEVLRNMLYAGSDTLERLGVVILDEVHYLADRERGSVWEEVLVHLGPEIEVVALSATVSNTEEFGDWMTEVRGDTAAVVSEARPVPLWQHVMLREGLFDLYAPGVDPTDPGPNPRLNPDLESVVRRLRHAPRRRGPRGRGIGRRPPPRFAVVDVLDDDGLLPAIVFVFSRAGCEDAVDQVRSSGLRLTTDAERRRVASIVEARCSAVPGADLVALGYHHWLDHLEQGIAAHHAGMIPLFKEVVEELFCEGLIKVVFATETLALGINMPARTVVLERLVKWDGEAHKDLTAGEYTQLTGRAGRRGIDVEGHAVVVEYPGFDVEILGRLASKRTYPLVSSFRPSYNMAINLVARSGVEKAREVLEMSFAQYQADRAVVSKARRVRDLDTAIAGYRESASCDKGDFLEYAGFKDTISKLEKAAARATTRDRRDASASALRKLRAGAVVRIVGGRHRGLAAVVSPDRSETPRPLVVTESGRAFRLSGADLANGFEEVGAIRLPKRVDTRRAQSRRDVASTIDNKRDEFQPIRGKKATRAADGSRDEVDGLRRQMRAHACHRCPDRDQHSRWADRYFKALRDKDRLAEQISRETGSIARAFDRRCGVLAALGYLEGEGEAATPTSWGTMLRTIYSENDLAIAECLRKDVWAGLEPPALAAVVSSLVYERRREDEGRTPRIPKGPAGPLGKALRETVRVASAINDRHQDVGLPRVETPQWGIVGPVHAWAQGKGLEAVLKGSDLAPGDLVRWFRQVIDVLDQVADVAPDDSVRLAAERAISGMRRGVVA